MAQRLFSLSTRTLPSLYSGRGKPTSATTRRETNGVPPQSTRYDVVIVGGGVMGSSSAYFLASRLPHKSVCVIERDFSVRYYRRTFTIFQSFSFLQYARASSMRSLASIRQQFSSPENIQMSLYSVDFLKNVHQHLWVEGDDEVDISFVEGGYLFLASESGEAVMRENHILHRYCGAHFHSTR